MEDVIGAKRPTHTHHSFIWARVSFDEQQLCSVLPESDSEKTSDKQTRAFYRIPYRYFKIKCNKDQDTPAD